VRLKRLIVRSAWRLCGRSSRRARSRMICGALPRAAPRRLQAAIVERLRNRARHLADKRERQLDLRLGKRGGDSAVVLARAGSPGLTAASGKITAATQFSSPACRRDRPAHSAGLRVSGSLLETLRRPVGDEIPQLASSARASPRRRSPARRTRLAARSEARRFPHRRLEARRVRPGSGTAAMDFTNRFSRTAWRFAAWLWPRR
jgi:hypothetical protein